MHRTLQTSNEHEKEFNYVYCGAMRKVKVTLEVMALLSVGVVSWANTVCLYSGMQQYASDTSTSDDGCHRYTIDFTTIEIDISTFNYSHSQQ